MLLSRTTLALALPCVLFCVIAESALGATHSEYRRRSVIGEAGGQEPGKLEKRWFFFDGGSLKPVGQHQSSSSSSPPEQDSSLKPSPPADPQVQAPGPLVGSSSSDVSKTGSDSTVPHSDSSEHNVIPVSPMRKGVPASNCRFQKRLDRLSDPQAEVADVKIHSQDFKIQRHGHVLKDEPVDS